MDLIDSQSLQLVNEPDEPTYHYRNRTGTSVLDLTIATGRLARAITNWLVNPELDTGSDHEVIQFTIVSDNIKMAPLPTYTNRYNWKKADWQKFSSKVIELSLGNDTTWKELCNHPSTENLEQAAYLLRDNLVDAIDYAIPTIRPSPQVKV